MAVGLQNCPEEDGEPSVGGEPGLQGLELWDVSDPEQPERLGFVDVGPMLFGGVHELYLFQREERVLVLAAVPFSEMFHPNGAGRPANRRGNGPAQPGAARRLGRGEGRRTWLSERPPLRSWRIGCRLSYSPAFRRNPSARRRREGSPCAVATCPMSTGTAPARAKTALARTFRTGTPG